MPFALSRFLRAGVNVVRTAAGADPIGGGCQRSGSLKQAGQIVVIFALMLTALIGLVGIAIDTTYACVNRFECSARRTPPPWPAWCICLATKIRLFDRDRRGPAERLRGRCDVTSVVPSGRTIPESSSHHQHQRPHVLQRIFGINTFTVARESKAVYVTPVPMAAARVLRVYALCKVSVTPCGAEPTTTEPARPPTSGVSIASQGFYVRSSEKAPTKGNGDAFNPTTTTTTQRASTTNTLRWHPL